MSGGRRFDRGVLVLALLVAAGCGRRRVAWTPQTTPTEGALVVLGASAPVRTRPDVRAPLVALGESRVASARFGEPLHGLRALRSRSGWVELETLDGGEPTCARAPEALQPFRLLLYAREESLQRVTRAVVERRFPDGTSARLARGVPVEQVRGRTHRVHFGPLVVVMELDPNTIGTRYLASHEAPPTATGWLSAQTLSTGAIGLGGGRVEARRDRGILVQASEPAGRGAHATVQSPCGSLTLATPPEAVEGLPLMGRSVPSPEAWVAAGTEARWPDGRVAGEARVDAGLGPEHGEPGCHRVLGRDELVLCFSPERIQPGAPPERGIAGALAAPRAAR